MLNDCPVMFRNLPAIWSFLERLVALRSGREQEASGKHHRTPEPPESLSRQILELEGRIWDTTFTGKAVATFPANWARKRAGTNSPAFVSNGG